MIRYDRIGRPQYKSQNVVHSYHVHSGCGWHVAQPGVRYQISFGYPLDMFEPGSLHEAWVMTIATWL